MGLLQSAQGLIATLLGLARTRLELLSVEMQELLARLVLVMVGAVAAILLGALALGFGAVALVLWVAPEYRVAVAAGLAGVFLVAAAFIAWRVRREARARPFAASLGEFERDEQALAARE
ncbi:MAG: phage holin family protein [Burkholderiales bacterium]